MHRNIFKEDSAVSVADGQTAEKPFENSAIRLDRSHLLLVSVAVFCYREEAAVFSFHPGAARFTKPMTFSTNKSGRTLQADGKAARLLIYM